MSLATFLREPQAIAWSRGSRHAGALIPGVGGGPCVLDASAGPAAVILDFGSEVVGTLEVTGTCAAAGVLALRYGEDLTEALTVADPYPADNWYRLPRDDRELAPGPVAMTNHGRRTFRFLHLHLSAGRIELARVSAQLEHRPVVRDGWCATADERLNAAWRICATTTRLCLQRYHEDGPKRDGMLWIGDARVGFLNAMMLHGDTGLGASDLRCIARTQHADGGVPAMSGGAGGHQHPARIEYMMADPGRPGDFFDQWRLVNYGCDLASMAREVHDHGGDDALAAELRPCLRRLGTWLRACDPRTARTPQDMITDDSQDGKGWWGSRCALAMQLVWGLADLAELARRAHEPAEVAANLARRDELRVLTGTWHDAASGLYRLDHDDPRPAWHPNTMAVLAGVAADPGRLLHQVPAQALDAQCGYASWFKHYGLLRAGAVDLALESARSWWGAMLANGATTAWDVCDPARPGIDRPTTHALSHCHLWSAGLAHLLPAEVVGIQPASPGYATVRLTPQLGSLPWAAALVPTPHGDVRAEWRQDGGRLRGEIELPAGVTGTVQIAGQDRDLGPGITAIG
jgi:alpha-L-rhamnosidase